MTYSVKEKPITIQTTHVRKKVEVKKRNRASGRSFSRQIRTVLGRCHILCTNAAERSLRGGCMEYASIGNR